MRINNLKYCRKVCNIMIYFPTFAKLNLTLASFLHRKYKEQLKKLLQIQD